MSAVNTFSPNLLNDFDQLKNFFLNSKEKVLQEISRLDTLDHTSYTPQLYYNRWEVVWIYIKTPFEYLFIVFFKAMSCLFSKLGCVNCSRTFTLLTKHHGKDFANLTNQETYQERFLMPSCNFHDLSTSDIYHCPPISVSSIEDASIRQVLFYEAISRENSHAPIFKENVLSAMKRLHFVNLYSDIGICRGDTSWWVYLYLLTEKLFKNPYEHAIAISKYFKNGAPREAAIIQALNLVEVSLLDMKFSTSLSFQPEEMSDKNSKTSINHLKELPAGVYGVGLHKHRIAYVKINDTLGFIFEPNDGLIALEGENQAEDLFKHISKNSNETQSVVYFESCSLKDCK